MFPGLFFLMIPNLNPRSDLDSDSFLRKPAVCEYDQLSSGQASLAVPRVAGLARSVVISNP